MFIHCQLKQTNTPHTHTALHAPKFRLIMRIISKLCGWAQIRHIYVCGFIPRLLLLLLLEYYSMSLLSYTEVFVKSVLMYCVSLLVYLFACNNLKTIKIDWEWALIKKITNCSFYGLIWQSTVQIYENLFLDITII